MSVSSTCLTALKTNTGNLLLSQNQGKGLCGVKSVLTVGASRPDGDSWEETVVCWSWYDKSSLYSFLVSVAWRVIKQRKQGHPTTNTARAIWCLMTPLNLGVDWWRTQSSEESQASELQIGKLNIRTWIQSCEKLTNPERCYSDLMSLFWRPHRHNTRQ